MGSNVRVVFDTRHILEVIHEYLRFHHPNNCFIYLFRCSCSSREMMRTIQKLDATTEQYFPQKYTILREPDG